MKLVIKLTLILFVFFMGNRLGHLFMTNPYQDDILESFVYTIENFFHYLSYDLWFVSFETIGLIAGLVPAVVVLLIMIAKSAENDKNYRRGAEHGTGRWGTIQDMKGMTDKTYETNTLLSQHIHLSMNTRKTDINNNIAVIGDSGSGKTRYFLTPNLLQFNCNPIVTDPKGGVLKNVGKAYLDKGYHVKIFNTVNFKRSMKFNPFVYIKDEQGILDFVNTLISNTSGKDDKNDFWVKAEKMLFCAMGGYVVFEVPEESRNFSTLIDLMDRLEARDDEEFESEIDKLFKQLEKNTSRNSFAIRQYTKFKKGAGESMKSILLSCAVRMSPFDIDVVREVTEYDEMDFEQFPEEKTALFLIIDDKKTTFNFLVAILQNTLVNTLCYLADNVYDEALPIYHRLFLDEFPNIGKWPDFEKLAATVRSRNISLVPIIQLYPQLVGVYGKENAKNILGNCATWLFLGGTDEETLQLLSKRCGNTTVDHKTTNESKGKSNSISINNSIIKRELIMPDEVEMIGNKNCIVKIKGVYPFKSKKYKLDDHPNYKLLAEANAGNFFDVEKYIKALDNDDWTEEVLAMTYLESYTIEEEEILTILTEHPELDQLDQSA